MTDLNYQRAIDKWMRTLRKISGMTIGELGVRSECSGGLIHNYECYGTFTPEKTRRIARALNIEVSELMLFDNLTYHSLDDV